MEWVDLHGATDRGCQCLEGDLLDRGQLIELFVRHGQSHSVESVLREGSLDDLHDATSGKNRTVVRVGQLRLKIPNNFVVIDIINCEVECLEVEQGVLLGGDQSLRLFVIDHEFGHLDVPEDNFLGECDTISRTVCLGPNHGYIEGVELLVEDIGLLNLGERNRELVTRHCCTESG